MRAIVEVDAFRRLVVGTDWADRRLHSAAMCAAARAAAEFAVAGFGPVLLIDCFGRDHAQAASHIVKGRGLEAAVITLWARPDVLRARLARRIGGYDDEQMALLMNAEMAAGGGALLDATEVDVQQLVEQIRVLIQGRS